MARNHHRQGAANPAEKSGFEAKGVDSPSFVPKGNGSSSVTGNRLDAPTKRARLFSAVSPDAPPPRRARLRYAALPLMLLAVLIVVTAKTPLVRFAVPVGLVLLAFVLRSRSGTKESSRRGVLLDGSRLFFQADDEAPRCVVALQDRFGLTLVKSPERDRIVAVWSSREGLFYVGTSLDKSGRRTLGALVDRAFTVLGDDAALEAIGPDGKALELAPEDFSALVLAVDEIDPACQHRLVLSDARGAPFTLDGRELVVGDRRFDLEAPLEWRPFVFQEALGQSVTIYQGTSIRQGGSEAVLVSLLPSFVPFEVRDAAQFDRAMLRDLRLVQAGPEDPPPRDARVAIDRLFVLPVRSALDTAPNANRRSSRARA